MSHPQIDGDTAPPPNATPCTCWEDTSAELRQRHGLELSDSLTALAYKSGRWVRLLPLQRADGKKIKRGEPSTIQMAHCPFCGVAYPTTTASA